MHFYISSGLGNIDQVRHVASRLKDHGWTHTCDWTNFDGSVGNSPDSLRVIGEREWDGVKAADVLIALTPWGRGTHIELGMAIALGKKIFLYHADDTYFKSDGKTCAFYWLPQVTQLTGTVDAAIQTIVGGWEGLGE